MVLRLWVSVRLLILDSKIRMCMSLSYLALSSYTRGFTFLAHNDEPLLRCQDWFT